MLENKCKYCGEATGNHDYGDKKGEPFELCLDCNEKFNSHKIVKCPKCGEYAKCDIIGSLKAIQDELSDGIFRTISYHDRSEVQQLTGAAVEACANIDILFKCIIGYFQSQNDDDKSACKATLIHLTNFFYNAGNGITDGSFASLNAQSSIETLLLEALTITKPEKYKDKISLYSQMPVCNGDYKLDIALCTYEASNDKFNLFLGIECEGYDYHYADASYATKTLNRINKIKMCEKIEVFQYSGSAIYSDCIGIANQIWQYIEDLFN